MSYVVVRGTFLMMSGCVDNEWCARVNVHVDVLKSWSTAYCIPGLGDKLLHLQLTAVINCAGKSSKKVTTVTTGTLQLKF
jgi:hypothetical protein